MVLVYDTKLKTALCYIQEYGLDLFVIQVWKDIRLAQGQDRTFSFGGDDVNKIWTPDTYFMNSKESGIKNVSCIIKYLVRCLVPRPMLLSICIQLKC